MNRDDPKMRRMVRNAVVLLVAFLLGLVPVLIRNLQLKQELARAQTAIALSDTRDLASRAYLEVSRSNFGLAAEHTSRLYERLAEVAQTGEEPARGIALDALAKRDNVMRLLATADGSARTELQDLTSRLLDANAGEIQSRARAK